MEKRIILTGLVFVFLLACSSGGGDGPQDTPADVTAEVGADTALDLSLADVPVTQDVAVDVAPEDIPPDKPEPVECDNPGYEWSPGTSIFVEKTEQWGLADIRGHRFNVVDYNNDGWPDLLVRHGGGVDDFNEGGARSMWLLRNNGDGTFSDETQASGLVQTRHGDDPTLGRPGEVSAAGDVDNDGDIDLAIALAKHQIEAGQETSELMLNNGDGTFSLGPAENAFREEGKYSVPAGVTMTDFDRDGNLDIWVTHNMVGNTNQPLQDRMYKGDGAGGFVDVTAQVGLTTKPWLLPPDDLNEGRGHSWAWSSAACDFNNDGAPDLLAASYGRCPNHLWQGNYGKNGTNFINQSVSSGYAYDDRMDWSDNEWARCFCKLHPDAEDCEGVPPPQYVKCDTDEDIFRWSHDMDREPWRLAGNSAQSTCEDVNNDGYLDIMTGEIVHWDVGSSSDPSELMFNTGEPDVRFVRPGNEVTGLVKDKSVSPIVWDDGDMTNALLDFDNDGWTDVYVGTSDYPYCRGHLYHQVSPEKFEEVVMDDFFEHLRSHGAVTADFDRDGDLDLLVGHSLMRCGGQYLDDCYEEPIVRYFENIVGNKGNWVQFKLEGTGASNRSAIGAHVTITTDEFMKVKEVDGAHGHFNTQKDPVLHFGLGASCVVDVEVRWPDAELTTQQFTVEGGRLYFVKQGEEPVEFMLP